MADEGISIYLFESVYCVEPRMATVDSWATGTLKFFEDDEEYQEYSHVIDLHKIAVVLLNHLIKRG